MMLSKTKLARIILIFESSVVSSEAEKLREIISLFDEVNTPKIGLDVLYASLQSSGLKMTFGGMKTALARIRKERK